MFDHDGCKEEHNENPNRTIFNNKHSGIARKQGHGSNLAKETRGSMDGDGDDGGGDPGRAEDTETWGDTRGLEG